jgi:hypothetical protein
MRRVEDDNRDVQLPAAVLEATARYLGTVVACDALAMPAGENPATREAATLEVPKAVRDSLLKAS